MKNAGLLNLPAWKEYLQKILVKMGRKDLLKLPLLGKENSDSFWSAFDEEEFYRLVQTGIVFENAPVKNFPDTIITSDSFVAVNRLKSGLEADTYFSAAIGGTFPFFRLLADNTISKPVKFLVQNDAFTGFVLYTMEKNGKSLEEAICDARWKELSNDNINYNLHGLVSYNRLVLQIAEAFGCFIAPDAISYSGINNLSQTDIEIAKELEMSIRLLGIAEYDGKHIKAISEPCMIPERYWLAEARGGSEMIYVKTSDGNSQIYSCPGSNAEIVVRGIVSDLESSNTKKTPLNRDFTVSEFESSFYLRFDVMNLTDTLSDLLRCFASNGIQIQKIYHPKKTTNKEYNNIPLVILTDNTSESHIKQLADNVAKDVKLAGLKARYRIIDRG